MPSPSLGELLVLGLLVLVSFAAIPFSALGLGLGLLALIAGIVLSRRGRGTRGVIAAILTALSALIVVVCAVILLFLTPVRIESEMTGDPVQVEGT